MSKLQELINELCPNGVEYKELQEIGFLYSGLTGKNKKDFDGNTNEKYVTYKNIFNNYQICIEELENVNIEKNEKQNIVCEGDILFTASSESFEEIGMSSLVKNINGKIYLNSFSFGFRCNNLEEFNFDFLKHIFRSKNIRKQIIKTANGVTRYNISKKKFSKIKIPVPPIEVQNEIVKILDNFTELTAELTAELTERKKQYEYYRHKLLNVENVEYKKIEEVCEIKKGKQLNKKELLEVGRYPAYNGGITYSGFTNDYNTNKNTTIISQGGASAGYVQFIKTKFWANAHCYCVFPKELIISKYLFYILKDKESYLRGNQNGAGIPGLKISVIQDIKINLPSIEEQERIVKILDKFDGLTNSISQGLPAEIEMRQKQYEYYRHKLLTFKEL